LGFRPTGLISHFQREYALHGLNAGYAVTLDDKLVFAAMMRSLELPHPPVFAYRLNGQTWWLGDGKAALKCYLNDDTAVVLKGIRGKKGTTVSITKLKAAADPPFQEGQLLQGRVRQADYAATIFPNTVNTIRLLTVTPPGGVPAVVAAVHRFGTERTGFVDNFSAGGLVAAVDPVTGQLSQAAHVRPGNHLVLLDRHPDTNAQISGRTVPDWSAVEALAKELCIRLPGMTYVGWDIALSANGPVIIEGNAHPSLRFFQLFGPLRFDPPTLAFMARFLPKQQLLAR